MKKNILQLGIIVAAVGLTYCLMSLKRPSPKQDRKITITITLPEAELIMKALGKLPLEESGNLYFTIQQQAQMQLQPQQAPQKKDTTTTKKKP